VTKPAVTRIFGRRATLKRSFGLLSDFRHEQSAPDIFYGALARDSVELISDLHEGHTGRSLDGLTVLDVGGGPGYFAEVFQAAGARYIPVEPDPSEMHAAGLTVGGAVRGSGLALPFLDSSVDICFSSNVAEHVSEPWLMAEEMLRVTKPGGTLVVAEFSHPTFAPFRTVYSEYLMRALPPVATKLSSNPAAYVYLAESIRAWPTQDGLAAWIEEAGWENCRYRNLSGGIVAVHRATKPKA
jgi:ubiquinone/menaquinone biosynthesis C-methylase UbiE